MKINIIHCECGSRDTRTKQVLDPESTEINNKAILACNECGAEWEGKIGKPSIIAELKKFYTSQNA